MILMYDGNYFCIWNWKNISFFCFKIFQTSPSFIKFSLTNWIRLPINFFRIFRINHSCKIHKSIIDISDGFFLKILLLFENIFFKTFLNCFLLTFRKFRTSMSKEISRKYFFKIRIPCENWLSKSKCKDSTGSIFSYPWEFFE